MMVKQHLINNPLFALRAVLAVLSAYQAGGFNVVADPWGNYSGGGGVCLHLVSNNDRNSLLIIIYFCLLWFLKALPKRSNCLSMLVNLSFDLAAAQVFFRFPCWWKRISQGHLFPAVLLRSSSFNWPCTCKRVYVWVWSCRWIPPCVPLLLPPESLSPPLFYLSSGKANPW